MPQSESAAVRPAANIVRIRLRWRILPIIGARILRNGRIFRANLAYSDFCMNSGTDEASRCVTSRRTQISGRRGQPGVKLPGSR